MDINPHRNSRRDRVFRWETVSCRLKLAELRISAVNRNLDSIVIDIKGQGGKLYPILGNDSSEFKLCRSVCARIRSS